MSDNFGLDKMMEKCVYYVILAFLNEFCNLPVSPMSLRAEWPNI